MNWNDHSKLKDKHAFLSASKYHWINYDEQKLVESFNSSQAAELGTEIHALAASCIKLGVNLVNSNKTLNLYVNDAIKYKMTPEQILYYSENCFGTADAICYRRNMLRIHDLKTGITPAHIEQLEIYAALFFLEYGHSPVNTDTELRIYQNDEAQFFNPEPDRIRFIMDRIKTFDKIIKEIKEGQKT